MKYNYSLAPILCMKRDKLFLNLCLEKISSAEPLSIIGIKGLGKDIIYTALLEHRQRLINKFKLKLKTIHATTKEEIINFLNSLETEKSPVLAIVNLSVNEDIFWYVEKIDQFRWKRTTNFNCITFSDIKPLFSAIKNKQSFLIRSLKILPPVDYDDTEILIKDFVRRFKFQPLFKQNKMIYSWSGGHVGLIKSLYLLLKSNPSMVFSQENLLKEGSVIFRLQDILQEIPLDKIKILLSKALSSEDELFFKEFFFLKNKKIFCPILEPFIKQSVPSLNEATAINLDYIFTIHEMKVFSFLKENLGKIVSREKVAEIIWEKEAVEKYSEWAIDQLIHRLRQKIRNNKLPFRLKTKKRVGFILFRK